MQDFPAHELQSLNRLDLHDYFLEAFGRYACVAQHWRRAQRHYTSNSKILAAAVEIYENAKHDGLASRENLATTVASAKANLVAVSVDGLDVDATAKWTNQSARTAMDTAISTAQAVVDDNSATQFAEPTRALRTAMVTYNTAKQDGLATAATLSTLIEQAQSSLVPVSADGSDIDASSKWTTQAARDAMDSAIVAAHAIVDDPSSTAFVAAMNDLQTAMDTSGAAKQAGTVDATDLSALIAQARDARIDNVSADGSDVWSDQQWVTQAQQDAYDAAIAAAQAYTAGTASTGTAIQHVVTSSGGHGSAGAPPSGSSGAPSGGSPSSGGTPPDKPSGSSSSSKSAS